MRLRFVFFFFHLTSLFFIEVDFRLVMGYKLYQHPMSTSDLRLCIVCSFSNGFMCAHILANEIKQPLALTTHVFLHFCRLAFGNLVSLLGDRLA